MLAIVRGPAPLDPFKRPQGIATDPSRGIILVSDTGNHRVATFDASYRSRGVIVIDRAVDGESGEPRSIAIGARKQLFMVDNLNDDVEVLTPRGSHLAYMPRLCPEDAGAATRPQDIVVGPSGRIYLLYGGDRPGLALP